MATQDEARIVKTPEVLGGKPRIAGRRIGVAFVHRKVEEAGLDPHAVADQHDLDELPEFNQNLRARYRGCVQQIVYR